MAEITRICMLAGDEPHYVHSLVQGLADTGLNIELLGSSLYEAYPYPPQVQFINVRRSHHASQSRLSKASSMLLYYFKSTYLIYKSQCRVLHLQRFRFNFFEGIFLVLLYRMMGKIVVYTAHNIQPKGRYTLYKYYIFSVIYRNVHHIICHTQNMKETLVSRYHIHEKRASIIHHGLNMSVPFTDISRDTSRQKLGIPQDVKTLLIFGRIKPYKGVEVALKSLKQENIINERILLIIAGGRNNNRDYLAKLHDYVQREDLSSAVRFFTYPIADDDIELFFKSADALLLPYTEGDFQSGVLFLAFRFGLPIITSNVGSFPEGIRHSKNGFIFKSGDPCDLAAKIEQFYRELHHQPCLRHHLRQQALTTYDWRQISHMTREVYQQLLHPNK